MLAGLKAGVDDEGDLSFLQFKYLTPGEVDVEPSGCCHMVRKNCGKLRDTLLCREEDKKERERVKTPPLDLYSMLWEYTVRLRAGDGNHTTRIRDYFRKTKLGFVHLRFSNLRPLFVILLQLQFAFDSHSGLIDKQGCYKNENSTSLYVYLSVDLFLAIPSILLMLLILPCCNNGQPISWLQWLMNCYRIY